MQIKFIKQDKFLSIPFYATEESAGADLSSSIDISLLPQSIHLIPTGIFLSIPKGYEGQIRSRSGLSSKGIMVINGTIDSDYRGEIKIIITNIGKAPYQINKGERIAQIVISSYVKCNFIEVEKFDHSTNRKGGFGSTGT